MTGVLTIELRDYQHKSVAGVRHEFLSGHRSVLLQLPTGGGKTAIATHIIKGAVSKGIQCHFWVHRRELVKQSAAAMERAGVHFGIIASGFAADHNAPAQIVSIGSLGSRLHAVRAPGLIIPDEAHHVTAASWAKLLQYYDKAKICGLSATPCRLDGQGLHQYFQSLVLGPTTKELIAQGWLSPYRLFGPSKVDLSHVHTQMGEHNKQEVDAVMRKSTVMGDAVKEYQRHVPGKRALVFAWSVESSIEIAARFNAAGISAAHIDGNTNDAVRDRVIRRFQAGEIKVLTNVDIVSEGFDVPGIDALFMLRPTKSLGRYLQMVGRGLRPSEGKEYCAIFDHVKNYEEHGAPDDDREWTLDGKKKKKKSASDGPLCRTCKECNRVSPLNVRICPQCGAGLIVEREMDVDENASLSEVDPATIRRQVMARQAQADTLDKLIEQGRARGMKFPEMWARHVMEARQKKAAAKAEKEAARFVRVPEVTIDGPDWDAEEEAHSITPAMVSLGGGSSRWEF